MPQDLYTQQLYCLLYQLYTNVFFLFSFMIIFPPFAWQMRAQNRPHTNKLSPPLFTVLHLLGRGSSAAIKLCLAALLSYHDRKLSTLKKNCQPMLQILYCPATLPPVLSFAQVMNTTRTDQKKKGNCRKV